MILFPMTYLIFSYNEDNLIYSYVCNFFIRKLPMNEWKLNKKIILGYAYELTTGFKLHIHLGKFFSRTSIFKNMYIWTNTKIFIVWMDDFILIEAFKKRILKVKSFISESLKNIILWHYTNDYFRFKKQSEFLHFP